MVPLSHTITRGRRKQRASRTVRARDNAHSQVGLVAQRDSGKNLCVGAPHVFQRFRQCFFVTGVKLNVVSGILRFQPDGFANDECNGFRFCFPDSLRRLAASSLAVKQPMARLVRQRANSSAAGGPGSKTILPVGSSSSAM